MPELPDVEIFKQYFDATALRQQIAEVHAQRSKMFTGVSPAEVEESCRGRRFEESRRYGKYLFARLDTGGWLVLHFGMTGYLKHYREDADAPGHVILLFTFRDGDKLAFNCRRRLGRIWWSDSPEDFIRNKGLGPDPRADGLDLQHFEEILTRYRGGLKPLLMDQGLLAGIGNIYSDEILFQAGLHPKTGSHQLEKEERRSLFRTMGEVLTTAIDRQVGEKGWPDDWLIEHRKPGETCPRCGGKIRKETIGGRSSYFCENHQSRQHQPGSS